MIVYLLNTSARKIVGTCRVNDTVKRVAWSKDYKYLAIFTRTRIILTDKNLQQISSAIVETKKLKSGVWDDDDVLIYTTSIHLKYCLPNGDHGVIKTMDEPLYLVSVKGKGVTCIDRQQNIRKFTIDTAE